MPQTYMVKSTVTQILNRFSNQPAFSSWNSAIREAVSQGHSQKSLLLFRQMKQNGLEPNKHTFPNIAKACGKLSNIKYAQIIHTNVAKSPFQSDVYVQTALIDMYVKCGLVEYAYYLFEEMPDRDIACWNAMLLGFVQLGCLVRALILIKQMRGDGVWPDSVTIIGLTQLSSDIKELRVLNMVHCCGIRIGLEADVSVANTWISAYAKCGDLGSAEMVFDAISLGLKTVVSWNSMIAGCSHLKNSFKAVDFYKRMLYIGFRPDISTILNLISSFVCPDELCVGKLTHCHGILIGCDVDITVQNSLISMYSKCGDISSARNVFDNVMEKTCVSWNAIIGGYAEKGELDEALALFSSMEVGGEKPDVVTMLNIISGCGQTGALEIGRHIDNYACTNRLRNNLMVCNALIDMYAKCGRVIDAWEVFNCMSERTIVSWTSMIAGFALNGEFTKAVDHFFQMLKLGFKPNEITFLAVLQACTHAGFLEKGWECFGMMTKLYGLNPGLDHYSCVADLLGRRGKLKEALDFIQNMPFKPDAGTWAALLSACKMHNNVEIGEHAAQCLFELEPHSAAPYVEMANLYASAGRWDCVATTRRMLDCNEVTKPPGQSFIHSEAEDSCIYS